MKIAIPENLVHCLCLIQEKTGMDEAMSAIDLIRQGVIRYANDLLIDIGEEKVAVRKEASKLHKDIMAEYNMIEKTTVH
jgi:hypothetical protein